MSTFAMYYAWSVSIHHSSGKRSCLKNLRMGARAASEVGAIIFISPAS